MVQEIKSLLKGLKRKLKRTEGVMEGDEALSRERRSRKVYMERKAIKEERKNSEKWFKKKAD